VHVCISISPIWQKNTTQNRKMDLYSKEIMNSMLLIFLVKQMT
jgi:hypothetical protein